MSGSARPRGALGGLALGALALGALALLGGCPRETPVAPATTGPLDARPTLGPVVPYRAPAAVQFRTAAGLEVWLVERHTQPIVAASLVVRAGSSQDPPGKGGLAFVTGQMLDEGAGELDALGIAAAFDDRGAELSIDVGHDGSRVDLVVLKQHFAGAFDAVGAIVARPRLAAADWERVSKEWLNDLAMRDDDADAVARVVTRAVLYGPDTGYGAPADGRVDSARGIVLDDVRAFYASHWLPGNAVLAVAGDVTRSELEAVVEHALGTWKAAPTAPSRPVPPPLDARPRFVLVDRKEAPQSVIAVARPGVAAADADAAPLELVNAALGGSFTSRLNQNLRETHHWTYGAGSRFYETVALGPFSARAAVETPATAPALTEMLREIEQMHAKGLDETEHKKVRAKDLLDLLETNESASGLAARLGTLALLGLGSDHDARAGVARQAASLADLAALAARYLDLSQATVVVVGPKDEVLAPLGALGLGEPALWAADGRPLGTLPPAPPITTKDPPKWPGEPQR
ncbi:MAG: insulinase family protein [Polyangiaceae bacterium]|nr:insulinase family protein [Polyangiaceae bacterium]